MAVRTRRNWRLADVKFATPAVMREVGLRIAVKVTNRTLSGLDQNGRRFKRYSSSYHRYGQTVDLHAHDGGMLDQLDVIEATETRAVVGFKDPETERLAAYHDGPRLTPGNPVPRRQFMGIPPAWWEEIVALIKRRMKL